METVLPNVEIDIPCPFCRNKKKFSIVKFQDDGRYAVECGKCEATGPRAASEQGALWFWIRGK